MNRCSCTASARPVLSHIARYAPEYRTSSYGTITQFKCKNNYEHLLTKLNGYDIYALRLCVQNSCLKRLPHCTQSRNAQACCTAHYALRTMVLPIGLMCCQHQHLGYLPIFGCIGCVQHHVGNVAIGERLYALVQIGSEPLRSNG